MGGIPKGKSNERSQSVWTRVGNASVGPPAAVQTLAVRGPGFWRPTRDFIPCPRATSILDAILQAFLLAPNTAPSLSAQRPLRLRCQPQLAIRPPEAAVGQSAQVRASGPSRRQCSHTSSGPAQPRTRPLTSWELSLARTPVRRMLKPSTAARPHLRQDGTGRNCPPSSGASSPPRMHNWKACSNLMSIVPVALSNGLTGEIRPCLARSGASRSNEMVRAEAGAPRASRAMRSISVCCCVRPRNCVGRGAIRSRRPDTTCPRSDGATARSSRNSGCSPRPTSCAGLSASLGVNCLSNRPVLRTCRHTSSIAEHCSASARLVEAVLALVAARGSRDRMLTGVRAGC
jgi:hypothetical protein